MQGKQEEIRNDYAFILDFLDTPLEETSLRELSQSMPITKTATSHILQAFSQQLDFKKLFFTAVMEGRLLVVKCLLKNRLIHADIDDNHAICLAAEHGQAAIVSYLLTDPSVNPRVKESRPLVLAAANGHLEVVQSLLANKGFDPTANKRIKYMAIHAACQKNHPLVFKLLLSKASTRYSNPLLWSCKHGYVEVAKHSLETTTTMYFIDEALKIAVKNANVAILDLLLKDGRAQLKPIIKRDDTYRISLPARHYPCIISKTAEEGQTEMVQRLLADERINPARNSNFPIIMAASNGHAETVKVLLADGRANPVKKNKESRSAVTEAVTYEQLEVIRVLLEDPRISKTNVYNLAIKKNKINVIKFMLENSYVAPNANHSMAFRLAAAEGDIETVKALLALPEINPDAYGHEAFRNAAANNHVSVIDLLLNNERINPQTWDNKALCLAIKNGHVAVVKRLLQDERINPGAKVLKSALKINSLEMLKLLLLDKRIYSQPLVTLLIDLFNDEIQLQFIKKFRAVIEAFIITPLPSPEKESAEPSAVSTFDPAIKSMESLEETQAFILPLPYDDLKQLARLILLKWDEIIKLEDPGNKQLREELLALKATLYQAIPFLATNGFYQEAIQCWLAIPPTHPHYRKVHFEAFQCAYFQYKNQEEPTMKAFFEALPCCLDEKGKLLDFAAEDQIVFDCFLVEALGITVYAGSIHSINLTTDARYRLLQYITMQLLRCERSQDPNPLLEILNRINPTYGRQGFFLESRQQKLIAQLNEELPDAPQSLQDLESFIALPEINALWQQLEKEVNQLKLANKNLKPLIRALSSVETALQETTAINNSLG